MADQQNYTNKLEGARILIIGGSSGLGFGVAEACVEYGARNVIVSSSNAKRVEGAVERLKKAYPSATSSSTTVSGIICDLGDEPKLEENAKNLFEQIGAMLGTSENGKLDHLIYTAGDPLAIKPLSDVDMSFVKRAGQLRLFAPLMVVKHALSYMSSGPEASITLTTGSVSEKPFPGWTVVAGFAAGLHGMVRNMALDLKPLRVNLVSHGGVETELWDMLGHRKEEARKMFKAKSTMGRVGRVQDVVEGYLWLLKDQNVSGSVVRTDGGHMVL